MARRYLAVISCSARVAGPAPPLSPICFLPLIPTSPGTACSEEKEGIVILKLDGGAFTPVGFAPMAAHVGWLTQHPTNGFMYCVSGSDAHAMKINADGTLSH